MGYTDFGLERMNTDADTFRWLIAIGDMKPFMTALIAAAAAVAFAQQPNTPDNYYAPEDDARVGQRFATQLQANVTANTEPRLDQIGNRLAARSTQFQYRFFVFDGGQPSQDTAPAAAFPADWRRLQLDEAIAVAGGMIFVPHSLLSRNDAQLAAILAHAMGHIALRHPTVGMTRGELAQVEVQAASRAMADEAPRRVHSVALKRFAFDRVCEMAADGYAVRLLQDVGLDPAALISYLRTLPAPQGEDLSVYPATAERIDAVQKVAGLAR
jgi:Zn-dependent protease with chaperone function